MTKALRQEFIGLKWIPKNKAGEEPYYRMDIPGIGYASLDPWEAGFILWLGEQQEFVHEKVLAKFSGELPFRDILHLAAVTLSCYFGEEAAKLEELADRITEAELEDTDGEESL